MTKKNLTKDPCPRCNWCLGDPIYIAYHDEEWGVPCYDDRTIFEFLILESAQAGLSWLTILRKREGYRKAFAGFDPVKVSRFSEAKIQKLLKDSSIVRNELKIRAAVNNAKCFLAVQKECGTFSKYMWSWVDHSVKVPRYGSLKEIRATTSESDAFAKDLKKRGFKFLGSTTIYAHMQALGMTNDHLTSCFRFKELVQ
jgi:DNA-3-methyladenine glycosylase I